MGIKELVTSLLGLFSGGLSGGISNIILLAALVILGYKILSFFKKKVHESSKKQALDDRSEMVSDNKSKDITQSEDEKSLDQWRKEIRRGTTGKESSD